MALESTPAVTKNEDLETGMSRLTAQDVTSHEVIPRKGNTAQSPLENTSRKGAPMEEVQSVEGRSPVILFMETNRLQVELEVHVVAGLAVAMVRDKNVIPTTVIPIRLKLERNWLCKAAGF